MELIKPVGSIRKSGRSYRAALFKCGYCGKEVVKVNAEGLKAITCSRECYNSTKEKRPRYISKNSHFMPLSKRAEICESFYGSGLSVRKTAEKNKVSYSRTSKILSLYFKKPKENLTLKSKV